MDAAIPKQIGNYEILRVLGRGGMGVVYLGRDPKLDREVAIKSLPGEFLDDPVRRSRFEREAKTLASLNHPNIATFIRLGPTRTGLRPDALRTSKPGSNDRQARELPRRAILLLLPALPFLPSRQAGHPSGAPQMT